MDLKPITSEWQRAPSFPLSTMTATDSPVVHDNPAISSSEPPSIFPILTSGNGEESGLNIPQQFLAAENLGNLTASARSSRTRVDVLPSSSPREITTAAPSIQDEEGNATPVQDPPNEEAVAEPMVSLTILVLSGDRKKFTFHPDTTAGRVKEVIWSTWDTGMSLMLPQYSVGTSDQPPPLLRLDKGHDSPESVVSPSVIFGEDTTR